MSKEGWSVHAIVRHIKAQHPRCSTLFPVLLDYGFGVGLPDLCVVGAYSVQHGGEVESGWG